MEYLPELELAICNHCDYNKGLSAHKESKLCTQCNNFNTRYSQAAENKSFCFDCQNEFKSNK